MLRPLLASAAVLAALLAPTAGAQVPAHSPCTNDDFTTAAHRGAAELAPENTLDAYRYAIAYGVDLIEVDVQQTLDGRYVAFHDTELDNKTDGTGMIATKTFAETQAINVADNPKWKGSVYDPARMPSLDAVLELAQKTGVGIYVDMKESVLNVPGMMAVFARYPDVRDRSAFLPYEPGRAAIIRAVAPTVDLMWSNLDPRFPAAFLNGMALAYRWFGSELDTYDAEKVDAIHANCGLVIPNVYDGAKADVETANLLAARAMGVDGAQINLPDVTADALDEPVATRVRRRDGRWCLVDAKHRIGLPRKPLSVDGVTATTDRDGCVDGPARASVVFAGDGSALASSR